MLKKQLTLLFALVLTFPLAAVVFGQKAAKEARWEGGGDDDMRAYRHEKVAKVGGINRDSDALHYGTDYSETDPSISHAARGNRHESSSRQASPEKRSNDRRDFSYGDESSFTASNVTPPPPQHGHGGAPRPPRYHSPSKPDYAQPSMAGSYTEPLDFDIQSQHTKSYHHPIPSLSGNHKPSAAGGFRRGRRDSLDSDS